MMLWITFAVAATPEEASKLVTGLTSWEARIDLLRREVEAAGEEERPRWVQAMRTVRLLAKYAPDTDRVALRDLVDAAVGQDPVLAAEAMKAARLGTTLPARVEGSSWMAHHPFSARTGSVLTVEITGDEEAVPRVRQAIAALAEQAKWTLGEGGATVELQVSAPRPSSWGPVRGSALGAQVTWPDGSTGRVDGFAAGPLREEAWPALTRTLAGNVLAHASLDPRKRPAAGQTAVLPDAPPSTVCLARLSDTTGTPLAVTFDGAFGLGLEPGAFVCQRVAAGTVVRGHEGSHVAVAQATTWLQVDHGAQFPWSKVEPLDTAKAERWRTGGKLEASRAAVVATP